MTDNLENTQNATNKSLNLEKFWITLIYLAPTNIRSCLPTSANLKALTAPKKVAEVAEWTKSWEYREKNFERTSLTVNPAKACQPLGALFVCFWL